MGPEKVKAAAVRVGVPENTVGLAADPTTVLGTASPTTEDMAAAYATFANRGERVAPTTIKGNLAQWRRQYTLDPAPQRAFDSDIADQVNYALQKVVTNGTGYAATALGRPAAGKTGTTDNNKSAWFVGYTRRSRRPSCWSNRTRRATRSRSTEPAAAGPSTLDYPAHIWTDYMQGAMADMDVQDFHESSAYGKSYGGGTTTTTRRAVRVRARPVRVPVRVPAAPGSPSARAVGFDVRIGIIEQAEGQR